MEKDQREAIRLFAVIVIAVVVLIGLLIFVLPEFTAIVSETFDPGLGIKKAAVLAFVLTVVIFLVFAVFAGDGLIGEIQFMIGGFFGFFLILWLMLAWVF